MEKKKILIVEDDLLQATAMKNFLEDLGYEVPAIAVTKDEAIAAAERVHPDLVLMDVALEEKMAGIEAAKVIRERFNIPFIYVTAYLDEKTMEEMEKTNPIGYIVKPFGEYDLRKAIEKAFAKEATPKKEHSTG